jgi:hypothetical protein
MNKIEEDTNNGFTWASGSRIRNPHKVEVMRSTEKARLVKFESGDEIWVARSISEYNKPDGILLIEDRFFGKTAAAEPGPGVNRMTDEEFEATIKKWSF